MSLIIALLKRDEGLRLEPYQDHLGFWTVGYGHLIDSRRGGRLPAYVPPAFPISPEAAEEMLRGDVAEYARELAASWPAWNQIDSETRRAVFLAMAFQLGVPGLMKFQHTRTAAAWGDWPAAAAGMRDSLWYRQTTARAERMASALESDDPSRLGLA